MHSGGAAHRRLPAGWPYSIPGTAGPGPEQPRHKRRERNVAPQRRPRRLGGPTATWALSVLDQEGVRRPQLCVGCKGCPSVAHRVGGMRDTVSPGGPLSMLEMWTQDDGMTRPVPGNFPR